ncbi:MAG: hypothetical protein ACI909_004319, partial [Planctomycetota bacterium]
KYGGLTGRPPISGNWVKFLWVIGSASCHCVKSNKQVIFEAAPVALLTGISISNCYRRVSEEKPYIGI